MLYAGLDLSRKRLDFHLLDGEGGTVDVGGPALRSARRRCAAGTERGCRETGDSGLAGSVVPRLRPRRAV
jgi:hypothetical protein